LHPFQLEQAREPGEPGQVVGHGEDFSYARGKGLRGG
jgi:hypothetical protein